MLSWSALGWILVAVAACALWRRRAGGTAREHAEVVRLAASIRWQLASRHPGVSWRGFVAGSSTAVLDVDGQETAVPLHRLRRELGAFPSGLPSLVDRLIGEVRAEALEDPRLQRFGSVATSILPQVRTSGWIDGQGGRFGDSGLLTRPLGADLASCYVVDDDRSMTFVCRRHLREWGRTGDEIHSLAIANLGRRTVGEPPWNDGSSGSRLVRFGDGYDAARVLLVEPERAGELLVAIPGRDELWLAGPGPGAVALQDRMARSAPADRAISGSVYRLTPAGLEAVGLPEQVSADVR